MKLLDRGLEGYLSPAAAMASDRRRPPDYTDSGPFRVSPRLLSLAFALLTGARPLLISDL